MTPILLLPKNLKSALASGHPWVYRTQFAPTTELDSGTWVELQAGNWRGFALWDAESAIAARVFSTVAPPDRHWVRERVEQAWDARQHIRDTDTSAYRLLFGEGDGLPGITVDIYNDYAVIATYAESVDVLLPWLINALRATIPDLRGIVRRPRIDQSETADHGKINCEWGELPPTDLVIEEHGMKMIANLFEGQKTGLFLDHRENRHTIEGWSNGLRVLNLFSYTGAFSLYAARGGAYETTSVDISPAAAVDAERNFELNGFDTTLHTFIAQDCFDFLKKAIKDQQVYDLIIIDPPSFARSKRNVHAALRAYAKINAQAIQCVAPGGLLATASCTSQVSPQAFSSMLGDAAAQTQKRLSIIHEAGHAPDHPVPAHFPEGRYLKFALARVVHPA